MEECYNIYRGQIDTSRIIKRSLIIFLSMNWRFTLPFAIVAVATIAVAGVATLNMGNKELAQEEQRVQAVSPSSSDAVTAKTNTAAVVSTGDSIADIIGVIDMESAGDSAMISNATKDAGMVSNDNADLSALSSSYDATTF